MKQRTTLKRIPQPPKSESKVCPACGASRPRRTHETLTDVFKHHYTLCRCQECWSVYWAENVENLEIERED